MATRTMVTTLLGITASLALAACGGGGGTSTGSGSNNSSTPAVTLSATSLTFASEPTGTSSTAQTVTVTNSGQAALTVSSVTVTGDFSETNTCSTVAAGANCAVSVTFKPTATGARTGTLSIADNASGSPQSVSLSGTGAAPGPAVTLTPTSLSFSQQTQGTTSTAQTVTLSNSGSAALTISGVALDNSSFQQTNTCGTSVAAGSTCTLSVTFTPASTGTLAGTLSITDNAADSPQKLALSGTGVAPPITVQSFAPASVLPGGQVTLTGTGFDATQSPLVTFAEASGFSAQVAPTSVSATSMTVSVPPFVDASSGALASGSFTISVTQTATGQTVSSAALPGLAVQALPTLPSAQGRLTLDFLQATRNYLGTTLISSVQGSSIETSDLDAALANELTALDTILPGIRAVVNGQSASYIIGTYAGQNVVVTPAALSEVDRLLLGMLAAQAGSSGATTGPPFAAITGAGGCQSAEAATAYNDYSTNASPNSNDLTNYLGAPQTSPCAAAQAFSDGVGIIAGLGGVALGVVAAAAAVASIPADAIAAALALPAAAVLYVTVVAAGGQIAVGGALAQTTAAGKQLIEQGVAEFENLGKTMLLKAGSGGILTQLGVNDPDAWLGLGEAVVDGKEVLEAFTKAPPYDGGTAPSSTFTLSLATAGSGSGGIASYPGTLACGSAGGSCSAGFAAGTQVFVAAVPATGSVFTGWGGDCSGTGACSVTMSANHSVTANFGPPPGTTFTGSASAPFNGTASDPAGGVYSASLTLAGSITLQTGSGSTLLSGSANLTGQINITVVSCPASDSCSGTPFSKAVTGPVSVDATGHFTANFSSGTHYPLVVTLTGTANASGIVASGSFSTTLVGTSTTSSAQTVTVLSGSLSSITFAPQ